MPVAEDVYLEAASRELRGLLTALDELGEVLEAELANDILTLEFPNGERCVINGHRAARQIWMAANRTAWHFDYAESGRWISTKTHEDLWDVVTRLVKQHLGRDVVLQPADAGR